MKSIKTFWSGNRRIKLILGTLIALVVSDGLISNFLIRRGLAWEGNPFLETLVGGRPFLVIKVLGVLLCTVILWDIHKQWPRLSLITSICFVGLYTGIVFWNLCVFLIAQA